MPLTKGAPQSLGRPGPAAPGRAGGVGHASHGHGHVGSRRASCPRRPPPLLPMTSNGVLVWPRCVSEREPGRVNGGSQEAFLGGNREGRVPAHLPARLASVNSNVQKTEERPRVYPETALVSLGFFFLFLVVFILPHSASLFHEDSMTLYLYCLYCN